MERNFSDYHKRYTIYETPDGRLVYHTCLGSGIYGPWHTYTVTVFSGREEMTEKLGLEEGMKVMYRQIGSNPVEDLDLTDNGVCELT